MSVVRALLADRRGGTAILTALSLALILGFVALGVETARGLNAKKTLQGAADAAARAGALAIRAGMPDPAAEARRIALAAPIGADARVAANWPPASGLHSGDVAAVEVFLARPRIPLLGRFLGDQGGEVTARAVARLRPGPQACLLALGAATDSLSVPRPSELRLDGCGVLAAASGVPSLRLWEADPYRGRVLPQPTGCTASGLMVTGEVVIPAGHSAVFCNGVTIAGTGSLRLGPGVHVVDGGFLTVASGGRLIAEQATILLRGTGGRPPAGANVQPGARVTLVAPAPGPGAGLALAAIGAGSAPVGLTSPFLSVTGAVHAPERAILFAGNAAGGCAQLVADRIVVAGPSRLRGDCPGSGMQPIVDRVARLVE
jgi:hypothetical protein